jgi:hypothetical protein
MPHLAFGIAFCRQLERLEKHVRSGVFDAWLAGPMPSPPRS